jgi:hypothetical protein
LSAVEKKERQIRAGRNEKRDAVKAEKNEE